MSEAPRVSVIIPALNHADHTYRCLEVLFQNVPRELLEVIVVDNGSTDHTGTVLAHFRVDHVIRLSQNSGRPYSLNVAAGRAKGRYLLFLASDTELKNGALEAMLARIESSPSVGAVGAKIINEDGRLQEAGIVVWRDGTLTRYGSGSDPELAAYNFAREVDACSATCLLVRREAFVRAGEIDLRFSPAQYDDVDLCFGLRAAGFRVIYEPRAVVAHARRVCFAAQTSEHAACEEINRLAFVDKRGAALSEQWPRELSLLPRARYRGRGLRILCFDGHVPRFDRDSGSVRMASLLELLVELGHQVTLVPDTLHGEEPYTSWLQGRGVEVWHGLGYVPDYIRDQLPCTDLFVLSRAAVALKYLPIIRVLAPRKPVVFDTVDLHFLREERAAMLTGDPEVTARAAWLRDSELYLARGCGRAWVVSGYERELLRRELPELPVSVIPNIHAPRLGVPPLMIREHLIFVGSFHHAPNVDAVTWFAREVFPLVRRRLPGMQLRVVGDAPPASMRALEDGYIEVTGRVPEIEPYLDRAKLMVAPIRYGAGLKGKIGAAMASGLPVVTTTVGAEGMGLTHGENVLIADRAEEMAQWIVTAYFDTKLWMRLSRGGREVIERDFSPAAVKEQLRAELADLQGGV